MSEVHQIITFVSFSFLCFPLGNFELGLILDMYCRERNHSRFNIKSDSLTDGEGIKNLRGQTRSLKHARWISDYFVNGDRSGEVKRRKIFFNAAGLYGNKHNIEIFFLFLNDAAVRIRLEIPIILFIFTGLS